MQKGETSIRHTLNEQWKKGGEGGRTLEEVLPCKTMLTVNVIAAKAANTSQSKSPRNPAAYTKATQALFVKLHLTTFNICITKWRHPGTSTIGSGNSKHAVAPYLA